MIGRVYRWKGGYWRVVARWTGKGPRNVLLERVVPWMGIGWGSQWFRCIDGEWWRPDAATYRGEQAERVVRPFRGLRRV